MRVCLSAPNSLTYPQGGHLWVFLNWALGFRSIGCEVVWLDVVPVSMPVMELQARLAYLKTLLSPFGIDAIAVDYSSDADRVSVLHNAQLPTLEHFGRFDLLFDLRYDLPRRLLGYARRSALLDIDPGHLHFALAKGDYPEPKHDVFFTIGETVSRSKYVIGTGRTWVYTPPCVSLPEWPFSPAPPGAPWTTVAQWWSDIWMPDETGVLFHDEKREGFRPFMDLPGKVTARFELALNLGDDPVEKARIERHGFNGQSGERVSRSQPCPDGGGWCLGARAAGAGQGDQAPTQESPTPGAHELTAWYGSGGQSGIALRSSRMYLRGFTGRPLTITS